MNICRGFCGSIKTKWGNELRSGSGRIEPPECRQHSVQEEAHMFFRKKQRPVGTYDHENKKPMIRSSICTGEQVAGFKDLHTGVFEEIMLLRNAADLEAFKEHFGIEGEIEKFY